MNDRDTSIAELAYRLWQERGAPDGSPEIDWQDAERQIRDRQVFAAIAGDESIASPHKSPVIVEIVCEDRDQQPSKVLQENLSAGV